MTRHENECGKFNLARKFDLIHRVSHDPDYFSPPTFHMEYEDPEDKVGFFKGTKFPKKKILKMKCCPFCGKILEEME
jgi:hypothetical protein